MLRIRLLGTPQIYLGETEVRGFVTRKAQALFFYLAVTPQPQTRDALASLFWRDLSDQQARNNLRRNLPNLRSLVGSHLRIERDLVAFDRTRPYALDTAEFTDTLNVLTPSTTAGAIDRLERALGLYHGDFLEGFSVGDAPEFEAWALVQREKLRRLAIWGYDRLADAYLERGQYEAGLEITNRLLALEPWYEAAYHKQMVVLVKMGQRGAALAQYEQCRAMLATEFGTEPAPEMTTLYEQIKAGETVSAPVSRNAQEQEVIVPPVSTRVERQLAPVAQHTHANWGMIPRAATFYGRDYELQQLEVWLRQERRPLVALLGIGGVGKTALAIQFVRGLTSTSQGTQASDGFDRILWRSLLNAPSLEEVVDLWLQELSDHELVALPPSLDGKLSLLYANLRRQSCLLVLDNLESILQEGDAGGRFQPGYEAYAQFLQQIGELEHRSCVLLTSRELPLVVARLERTYSAVRTLRLEGLSPEVGLELLRGSGLNAPAPAMRTLVQRYSGNPLALRLIADVVVEFYRHDVVDFLAQETLIIEDVRAVLDQQLTRLAPLEREVLFWLAIEREPVSLKTLARDFVGPPDMRALVEAVRSLHRRSLVEWNEPLNGVGQGGDVYFALQNVVLEYTTEQLRDCFIAELNNNAPDKWVRFALIKAQAADYVRDAQVRLLLHPIAARLQAAMGMAGVERKLQGLLAHLRTKDAAQMGYAAANILHLALHLDIELAGWDFSHLPIWEADLRKGRLAHTNFAYAHFANPALMEKFDAILAVALSPDGELLAAGGASSNIHLWRVSDMQLLRVYPGEKRWVWTVAFGPNGRILASGGSDCTVRLWNVPSPQREAERDDAQEGHALLGHTDTIFGLAFHPNGRWLASASADQTIRIWDVVAKAPVRTLEGHGATVYAVAFEPQGRILASASRDHSVRLWRVDTGECLQVLEGHQSQVIALHFAADGRWLVTASVDGMIQVWQVRLNESLKPPLCRLEHSYYSDAGDISALAITPGGEAIATNGPHATIRIRVRAVGSLINTFHGHTEKVQSLAFHPNGNLLFSGGLDQSVRVWDVTTGYLLRTLQGHTNAIHQLTASPDGTVVVSGHSDGTLGLWAVSAPQLIQSQAGHAGSVQTVAFHPSGRMLASGGSDGVLQLWRVSRAKLTRDRKLQDPGGGVHRLAFSPSGQHLASSSEDQTIRIWDMNTGACLEVLRGHMRSIRALAFGAGDADLLSGSEDGQVYRWTIMPDDHTPAVPSAFAFVPGGCECLALSADASLLAGAGPDHCIRLWRIADGNLLAAAKTPVNSTVYSLIFRTPRPGEALELVSSSGTGAICCWNVDPFKNSLSLRYLRDEHKGSVRSIEMTSDGETLMSGGADETLRFWNVETGECVRALQLNLPYAGMNIAGATGLTGAQRTALAALGANDQDERTG